MQLKQYYQLYKIPYQSNLVMQTKNMFDQKVKFRQSMTQADTATEIVKRKQDCSSSPPVNHLPIIAVKTLPKALFTFPCMSVCACMCVYEGS